MTNKDIQDIFSKNLIKLLENKNSTQSDLAKYIGVSNTTINNYVKGYNLPRMDRIDKIGEYFGVSRSELISENNDNNNDDPELKIIARARKDMSEEDRKKMMNVLKASFDEFSKDYDKDK